MREAADIRSALRALQREAQRLWGDEAGVEASCSLALAANGAVSGRLRIEVADAENRVFLSAARPVDDFSAEAMARLVQDQLARLRRSRDSSRLPPPTSWRPTR